MFLVAFHPQQIGNRAEYSVCLLAVVGVLNSAKSRRLIFFPFMQPGSDALGI